MYDLSFNDAVSKAEHLIALGQTKVYLRDKDPPWQRARWVEVGGGYRLNGPTGCYFIAEEAGLELAWCVDFEQRDANGRGVSLFDRDRLRDVALKLPPATRKAFAALLKSEVLPGLEKHTDDIRTSLGQQLDSEDCVRGLIAFAEGGLDE